MPTLFELVKKSGYDVLKTAMMREITYPATASITDVTTTVVDFADLTRLDEDGKYVMHLRANAFARQDINTIMAAFVEHQNDFQLRRADKLIIKTGGFTEVILENSLRPNTGISIAINYIAVKHRVEESIRINDRCNLLICAAIAVAAVIIGMR
jgi:hypothetical protein